MKRTRGNLYPWVLPTLLNRWPDACAEFRFHPDRKWRADFAIPSKKILIEIEGGIWTKGRHTRGSGFVKDMAKYNSAAALGYRVFRYSPADARDIGFHLDQICPT